MSDEGFRVRGMDLKGMKQAYNGERSPGIISPQSCSHRVLVANLGLMGPPSGMTVHLSWKHTTDDRRWRDMVMGMNADGGRGRDE